MTTPKEPVAIVETRERIATATLSREDIEDIMTRALVRWSRDIGLDAKDPKAVFRLRENLVFLNDWRETCDLMKRKGVLTGIGTIVAALLFIVAMGLKSWVLAVVGQ